MWIVLENITDHSFTGYTAENTRNQERFDCKLHFTDFRFLCHFNNKYSIFPQNGVI